MSICLRVGVVRILHSAPVCDRGEHAAQRSESNHEDHGNKGISHPTPAANNRLLCQTNMVEDFFLLSEVFRGHQGCCFPEHNLSERSIRQMHPRADGVRLWLSGLARWHECLQVLSASTKCSYSRQRIIECYESLNLYGSTVPSFHHGV